MRTDIRFAGIAMSWTAAFSKKYADKLFEMGMYAKVMFQDTDHPIVAYSHKPFNPPEAHEVFDSLNQ